MWEVFLKARCIFVYNEIVILVYFMNFSNCDMVFCSLDGKPIRAMEGFSVNVDIKKHTVLIAGICAGVDVLDNAGILCDVKSTHSSDEDLVCDKNIITARANAYVDFAIEVAKKLDLFVSEEDLQETIDFWKHYNRVR